MVLNGTMMSCSDSCLWRLHCGLFPELQIFQHLAVSVRPCSCHIRSLLTLPSSYLQSSDSASYVVACRSNAHPETFHLSFDMASRYRIHFLVFGILPIPVSCLCEVSPAPVVVDGVANIGHALLGRHLAGPVARGHVGGPHIRARVALAVATCFFMF